MIILGHDLNVDIQEELDNFTFTRSRIRGNKLQSCSPFREEKSPSFAVNLDNGIWIDSGATTEEYRKGNFISLLAYLRSETYSDIEDYLIEKYGTILADVQTLKLEINLSNDSDKPKQPIFNKKVRELSLNKHDYLLGRGISKEVQKLFQTGYDEKSNSVSLPWHDGKGFVINVKYRSTKEKTFYYEKEGLPIKNFVYGIFQCIKKKATRVYVCESEIDALTLWTYGYAAVAIGGSSLSEAQKTILLSAGFEDLVIATDNDLVGRRVRDFLFQEFGGMMNVFEVYFPKGAKDINDIPVNEIHNCVGVPKRCFMAVLKA